jgi:radical SAM superfamily enzyme YgiQ (UPF0313 family)
LRSQGVKNRVIDLNVKLFNNAQLEKKYFWEIATINNFTPSQLGERFCAEFKDQIDDFINEIVDSPESVVGFSTTIASVNVAMHIAHQIKIKDPSKIVILGGPGVFWDTQIIDPERLIDIFVIGEGELPMLEIIRRFEKSRSLSDLIGIPGTMAYLKPDYYPFTASNPIKNIDEIPLVDFSGFDLKAYNTGSVYQPLPILISRGCINRCSFCIDHKMSGPFRNKSPQKVFEELKYYTRKLGVLNFEFNDLLCNGNLRQLESICDLIIKEGLKIRWGSYAAVRKEMSPQLLKKIKDSGCIRLCYGVESASDVVLKKMNKTFNSAIAQQVIRDTHNAGILTAMNIIIGHPGESEAEFKDTYNFVIRNKEFIDEITNVSTCFLMKETELIKNLDKFGIFFKKSIRERLKIFNKNNPGQCNYRKFYVLPDNSPRSRAMRLRRMLSLIFALKIPCMVVNRVSEDDNNFNKNFKKLFQSKVIDSTFSIQAGLLKISCDPEMRMIHIYFKAQRLTSDIGLNTSFGVEGKWFDSTKGKWKIKTNKNRFSIRILFSDLPISQDWLIRLHKESLFWKVKTYFNDKVNIDQQKSGFIFSEKYSKYMLKGEFFTIPPAEIKWKEVDFQRAAQIKLIPEADLPVISFCRKGFKQAKNFIQIQNLPATFYAKMVNFCRQDSARNDDKKARVFKKKIVEKQRLKFVINNK